MTEIFVDVCRYIYSYVIHKFVRYIVSLYLLVLYISVTEFYRYLEDSTCHLLRYEFFLSLSESLRDIMVAYL